LTKHDNFDLFDFKNDTFFLLVKWLKERLLEFVWFCFQLCWYVDFNMIHLYMVNYKYDFVWNRYCEQNMLPWALKTLCKSLSCYCCKGFDDDTISVSVQCLFQADGIKLISWTYHYGNWCLYNHMYKQIIKLLCITKYQIMSKTKDTLSLEPTRLTFLRSCLFAKNTSSSHNVQFVFLKKKNNRLTTCSVFLRFRTNENLCERWFYRHK